MTVDTDASAPPARGTRPRNRRASLIAAARELFSRHGYTNVAMSDIATAVGIGPSALYRHFRGKQELLHAVVAEALETSLARLHTTRPGDLGALSDEFAKAALSHRELGVLWQREARHLPAEQQAELGERLHAARRLFVDQLTAFRPGLEPAHAELLAWSTLDIAASIAYQHIEMPTPEYTDLIAGLVRRIAAADLPHLGELATDRPDSGQALSHRSRRERLLAAATRLFAERGYASVSLEDTGAAVGIAGQSIYNHFTSKHEILATAMNRSAERLWLDLAEALASARDHVDALRLLVLKYTQFALAHPHLVTLIVTETEHLPDDERHRIRQAQRDYIDEWLHLMGHVHPGMSPAEARIRTQAVLTIANDIARTPRLRARSGIAHNVHHLGCVLLGLDSTP
ncbi:TetR/AcrR family transcriptional regulator [Streptomyces sp. NK08204]|uniref:TetR/AcrR family transcriptional regulator n=1 Tax=Streptomyces sp. NK08204 TaxID=2873260 RepID=UPI001CEC2B4F|nr:TetR/AcrR family transcriptional regulator [Streptomyces sp. NK08204]